MKSELVDLAVIVHGRTAKAILVSDSGEREDAEWVPLSQVEVEEEFGGKATVTMPEWLAIEKGFV